MLFVYISAQVCWVLHPLHVSGCGNVMSLVEILSFTTCHYNGKDLGTSFPQRYVDAQKYLMMNGFITAPDKLNVSLWMEGVGQSCIHVQVVNGRGIPTPLTGDTGGGIVLPLSPMIQEGGTAPPLSPMIQEGGQPHPLTGNKRGEGQPYPSHQ